jgi:hypothetical protein
MRTQQRTNLPDGARAALAQLGKAFAYAQDLNIDPWEFALPLAHLLDFGVDKADLRWLVLNGYVTFRDRARRFQPGPNAAVSVDPRFLPTEAGVWAAGATGEAAPEIVSFSLQQPRWDSEHRILYLGWNIVKRYKRPSPNQDIVLGAFEEEGWPSHIYDPLPPKHEVVRKLRLHATVEWLNRNQEARLMRFRGDGTGDGICWEQVDASTIPISAKAPEKRRLAA